MRTQSLAPLPTTPELSRYRTLADRDRVVWRLLTEELAPTERIEGWYWQRAALGPRSWTGLLVFMVCGLWWHLLRLVAANEWRRMSAFFRRDSLVFRADPYVLMARTDRRFLATRIEFGRRLWRRETAVRRMGELTSLTEASRIRLTPVLRSWVLEIEGAPQCPASVERGADPKQDAYVRRGAELCAALEAAGWVEPVP